jgi:hypothetical protein
VPARAAAGEYRCRRRSHAPRARCRVRSGRYFDSILDNRLAEDATWDFELLAKEIEFLQNEGIELQATGFEIPEVEMIFDAVAPSASNTADDTLPNLTPDRVTFRRLKL